MKAIEKLEIKIHKTRQSLYEIIDRKGNLLDIEVIKVSQNLDKILNEYDKLVNKGEQEFKI